MAAVLAPTLVSTLWPAPSGGSRAARNVLLALVGTLALTVSAKTQIPFWPVPMTMQTFVVLVIGMAYGTRLGVATIALYLLEGALATWRVVIHRNNTVTIKPSVWRVIGCKSHFTVRRGYINWILDYFESSA